MFDRINEIIKNIEDLQDEIKILLGMSKISLVDYIMIKRGSADAPEWLNMSVFSILDDQIGQLKKQIDALNKIKREMLVF